MAETYQMSEASRCSWQASLRCRDFALNTVVATVSSTAALRVDSFVVATIVTIAITVVSMTILSITAVVVP